MTTDWADWRRTRFGVYLRSVSGVVDVQTVFLGIEVDLILFVPDSVDVLLNIVKAVFEERAEEAGLLLFRTVCLLIRSGESWSPRGQSGVRY